MKREEMSPILRLIEEIKDHENELALQQDNPDISSITEAANYFMDRKIRMVILDVAEKMFIHRPYRGKDYCPSITAIDEAADFVKNAFIYLQVGETDNYLRYLESVTFSED